MIENNLRYLEYVVRKVNRKNSRRDCLRETTYDLAEKERERILRRERVREYRGDNRLECVPL